MLPRSQYQFAAGLQTPCYIFSETEFRRSYRGLSAALQAYFDDVTVAYSVKTNSHEAILRYAHLSGADIEVVSHDEYRLARSLGVAPRHIVYNGPLKSQDTFAEAVINGAVVNIDTPRQLAWLKDLPTDGDYRIGLRVNIDLGMISPGDAEGSERQSRFGFSDNCPALSRAIDFVRSLPNVRIAGLHLHRSTYLRRPLLYRRLAAYASSIVAKYGLQPEYLDFGGGFYGRQQGKPLYAEYAEALCAGLDKTLRGVRIIVEPGYGLVETSVSFLCSVIDSQQGGDGVINVMTDGSRLDIDPQMRHNKYLYRLITDDCNGTEAQTVVKQHICGCTCMENDRLLTLHDAPTLHLGDRIIFDNIGAYTMSFASDFIRRRPGLEVLHHES